MVVLLSLHKKTLLNLMCSQKQPGFNYLIQKFFSIHTSAIDLLYYLSHSQISVKIIIQITSVQLIFISDMYIHNHSILLFEKEVFFLNRSYNKHLDLILKHVRHDCFFPLFCVRVIVTGSISCADMEGMF